MNVEENVPHYKVAPYHVTTFYPRLNRLLRIVITGQGVPHAPLFFTCNVHRPQRLRPVCDYGVLSWWNVTLETSTVALWVVLQVFICPSVHPSAFLSVCASFHLSVHPFLCPSIDQPIHPCICGPSICLSIHPCVLSICLSVNPSFCPCICRLSFCLSLCPSVCGPSICLSWLSICLSFWKCLSITNFLKQKKSDNNCVKTELIKLIKEQWILDYWQVWSVEFLAGNAE